MTSGSLCGVWVDDLGRVHTTRANPDGGRVEGTDSLRLFAWLNDTPPDAIPTGFAIEQLAGDGPFDRLVHADNRTVYDEFLNRVAKDSIRADIIKPLESQYLLQQRVRLYQNLPFAQLRRMQLDIEVASCDGTFPNATRPEDRILAVGLRVAGKPHLLTLDEMTDAAERKLLEAFNAALAKFDPDVIEGHNLFKFDLDYLRARSRKLRVPCLWGRYGQPARFRNARLKVAERWVDFPRCDLAGRAVIDTYLLVQLYDLSSRELTSYGLKEAAVHFGITSEDGAERTYLAGNEIQGAFFKDNTRFRAYLEDDLRETHGLADQLLPTYFEQTRTFPILLQDATLRGATTKIDLLFQEEYYHARQSCPVPPAVETFEGGYTRSFREGVFRHVLHFDVASLYPSLLLTIGRNPRTDTLGVFIPLLRKLREYRLKYKQLARTAPTEEERSEAHARQSSFKILINSFYGYLGFSGARFGDGELAAEVTRQGRELLQRLIDEFSRHGCTILEADTDGIYLSSDVYYDRPEALLALVTPILPAGIELEHDGKYAAMFCYKAKNYALYDGEKILLRGSALRSRGTERYLKRLTDQTIAFLLGASTESPLVMIDELRKQLRSGMLPVKDLAKGETLNQNLDAYERFVAGGGKPRRASAEAGLLLNPRPRMGDRVLYYIVGARSGRLSDWQRARALALYDPASAPYDRDYYLEKLEDWMTRYGSFLGVKDEQPTVVQGELPF